MKFVFCIIMTLFIYCEKQLNYEKSFISLFFSLYPLFIFLLYFFLSTYSSTPYFPPSLSSFYPLLYYSSSSFLFALSPLLLSNSNLYSPIIDDRTTSRSTSLGQFYKQSRHGQFSKLQSRLLWASRELTESSVILLLYSSSSSFVFFSPSTSLFLIFFLCLCPSTFAFIQQ